MVLNNDFEGKTDEELVVIVLEDNQDHFLHLIKRYEAKLLRYIKRLSNISDEDAEDVLQEIFIKVYQNLNDFNLKLKLSSWIYRIAHNEIISNYRKLKSKSKDLVIQIDDELFSNISSELDLVKEVDNEMKRQAIFGLINSLENKYKEVLILKFFEDKDYKEISFILKKPIGTVGTLINRAKSKLKDKIKQTNF